MLHLLRMLSVDAAPQLRMMLRILVAHDAARDAAHVAVQDAAHDAAHDADSLQSLFCLVHICAQLGCARRLAALAAEVCFAYYFCSTFELAVYFSCCFCLVKLRLSSWSFPNITVALESCDFRAEAARARFVQYFCA